LKSFWRKPRDDTSLSPTAAKPGAPSVRYRYDRIESQILQLADSSFILKDYETAISMYKLVREDYKSDRSNLHLVHTYLMIAVSYLLSEPSRTRDILSHLETVTQLLQGATDPPHAVTYYALLTTEIYTSKEYRQYIDAAQLLLLAAGQVAKYPVLCALLTEKAASYYLIGSYTRRFVLYNILAGHKLRSVGGAVAKHAIKNFTAALLLHESSRWGDIKAKLYRAVAQELKLYPNDSPHENYSERSLFASLLCLITALTDNDNVGGKESIADAATIYEELLEYKPSVKLDGQGYVTKVSEGWPGIEVNEILASSLPVATFQAAGDSSSSLTLEINELPCPEINMSKLSLMMPFNGVNSLVPWEGNLTSMNLSSSNLNPTAVSIPSAKMYSQAEQMKCLSDIERIWALEYQGIDTASLTPSASSPYMAAKSLGQRWVEAEIELEIRKSKYLNKNYKSFLSTSNGGIGRMTTSNNFVTQIPLRETITLRVQLRNKLPLSMQISSLRIDIEPETDFEIISQDLSLSPKEYKEVFLTLRPLTPGHYSIDRLRWNLSESLVVRKSIRKTGHASSHCFLSSEANSLKFEVVAPCPLITMIFEGVSEEVLQGQLLKTILVLRNDGNASAKSIFLKISQPCFVFTSSQETSAESSPGLLDFFGQSCTLLELPADAIIAPGGEYRLQAWLRLTSLGKQIISVLASYHGNYDDASNETNSALSQGRIIEPRTSFVSVNTTVIPSIKLSTQIMSRPSALEKRTVFVELQNNIGHEQVSTVPVASTAMTRPSRERNSSLGQFDLLSDFASLGIDSAKKATDSGLSDDALEEGCCQIEGIWLLGCAAANTAGDHVKWKSFVARSTEKIVVPVVATITHVTTAYKTFNRVVNLEPGSNDRASLNPPLQKQLEGQSSWPVPLSSSQSTLTAIHLTSLLERFVGMSYASTMFRRDIHEAKEIYRLAQEETQLPRTITQVRKDRQREQMISASTSQTNLPLDQQLALLQDTLEDIDLNVDSSSQGEIHKTGANVGYPMSAHELSVYEAQTGNVNIMVIWKCKWQGKIRLGMHYIPHVSIISQEARYESSNKKIPRALKLPDSLLIGIYHEKQLKFAPSDATNTSRGLLVPVTVRLQSAHPRAIYLNVEVVDRKDTSTNASTLGNIPAGNMSKSAEDMNSAVAKSSSRGMLWHCKTKYQQVYIPAFSFTSLLFQALISHPGVYDLKR
jgi:hypothetical protein